MLSRSKGVKSLSSAGDKVWEISVVVVLVSLVAGSWSFQLGLGKLDFVVSLGGVLSLVLPVMLIFTFFRLQSLRQSNHAQLWMTLFMWAWILWLALSSMWSDFDGEATHNIRNLLVLGLGATLLSVTWPRLSDDGRDRALASVLFVTVGVFVLAVLVRTPDSDRLLFPGGGPITFSRLMALGFLLALYVGIRKKTNLVAALSTVFLIGMFFAGSRGVLAAFVLSSLLTLLAIWLAKRWSILEFRKYLVTFACSSLALYCLSLLSASQSGPIASVSRYTDLGVTDTTERDVLFLHAWKLFTQSPLWGVGLDGYRSSFAGTFPDFRISGEMYAHNIFLASLAEGGIVGFSLIFIFFAVFLMSLRRSLGESRVLLLASISIFFLLQSQLSGDYYDSRLFWIFAMLAVVDSRSAERGRGISSKARIEFWLTRTFARFRLTSEAKESHGYQSGTDRPRVG